MINGTLRGKIDKLWLEFHSGGITNPLSVIEQISFLLFARMLDIREQRNEKKAQRIKTATHTPIFPEDKQHLRWSSLIHQPAEEQLRIVQEDLFPFFRTNVVKDSTLGKYLQDAQCIIQKPSLLKTAINTIQDLPLATGDTKGDLYEYLLSKLTTAGVAGQFRTPRHIIRAMAEMLAITPADRLCDPACGTGGFLIGAMEYLRREYSTKDLIEPEMDEATGEPVTDDHGKPVYHYPGDKLHEHQAHIQNDMFHGFDFDSTMLRIAAMNMLLHGIESPAIEYQDTLADTFHDRFPQSCESAFDVILANPPFKGSIDADSVHKSLTAVAKTKKTELLFLVLMLRMLATGGRCAVIVPDGVLFGSSKAHTTVRQLLVEKHQLDGVVSLPSGVFKPYAGVSTAILFFTKGGETKDVWFYKVENDGYSLDDKRDPVEGSDMDDLVAQWRKRNVKKMQDRTAKCFFVPKADIAGNKYDLSVNRYRETEYEEVEYEAPKVILGKLRDLESEILSDIEELEGLLG